MAHLLHEQIPVQYKGSALIVELLEYICRCASSLAAAGRPNQAAGTAERSASSRHLRNRT